MAIFDAPPIPDPSSTETEHGFPLKPALALACAVAFLTAAHFSPLHKGLSPVIFPQATSLHLPHAPAPIASQTAAVSIDPRTLPRGMDLSTPNSTSSPQISTIFIDDSRSLDPFFEKLYHLEEHKAQQPVIILHYGDSPTTADLITGDVRAMLQKTYGDAGQGFNLIAKPWAWYGHRDVDVSGQNWTITTGVGGMRQGTYGLGGATFTGGPDAHSTIKLKGLPQSSVEIQYLARANGGTFTVSTPDHHLAEISTQSDTESPFARELQLPENTKQIDIRVTSGQVNIFGIDLRRNSPGVRYHSLGLNGASTTVLSRTYNADQWSVELQHATPSLVIINYGTNESSFAPFVTKLYEPELRTAISRIRKALPNTPILIMSPMDRGQRDGADITTMATIPQIIAIQKRVAADTKCAFFDTYDAMGGSGTVARWYTASPRLMTADFIHPTPQGAFIVAQLFFNNLQLGYDRWKSTHNIHNAQPTTALPPPQPAPAIKPITPPAEKPSAAKPVESTQTPDPPTDPLPDASPAPTTQPQPSNPPESPNR